MTMSEPRRSTLPPPPAPPVTFHLELPIEPQWQNVDLLRLAILNCLHAVFGDPELSESVGIVTSELLENAIKYGDWAHGPAKFLVLSARGHGNEVLVEVASPVHEGSPHLANIASTIEWIRRFPTAREAYVARMRAIAEEPDGQSRMGLVRIAYEGPCNIDATHEKGMMMVRATIPTVGRDTII
jgi:hypothetical protein